MGKKPKTNAEILVWRKDIIKTYACLNMPKQQKQCNKVYVQKSTALKL